MKAAFVLLVCAAAVSSFSVVNRAGSGSESRDEDFGAYAFDYGAEYNLERFGQFLIILISNQCFT